ncbi:MAG: hypothetical protein ACR2HP_16735, partial [Ilumatobacteraceae bacterium]
LFTAGQPRRRLLIALVAMLIVLVAVLARVGLLQTVQGDVLRDAASQQWTRDRTLPAQRGAIFDRNGDELAISVPAATVAVNSVDSGEREVPSWRLVRRWRALIVRTGWRRAGGRERPRGGVRPRRAERVGAARRAAGAARRLDGCWRRAAPARRAPARDVPRCSRSVMVQVSPRRRP